MRGGRPTRGPLPRALLLLPAALAALLGAGAPTRDLRAQERPPAPPPDSAPGAEAVALLEAAAETYRTLDGFCADFHQVLEVTLLNRTVESRGELCQAPPDRFSMRFSDPPGDRVVVDGQWVWVHYPSTDPRQVLRFPLETGAGQFDFHRAFLENPGERYRVTDLGRERLPEGGGPEAGGAAAGGGGSAAGTEVRVLDLEPRSPGAFTRARLWLDPERGIIRQVRIQQENGSIRTVRLDSVRLNPDTPPEIFRFEPPPGADVITRG